MDIAIASVMRDGLLRRSEAAALTWADVERRPDGTGRLTVRRSKGDQAGEGAELYIGRDAMAALERIRPEPSALAAPVFGGLGGRAIADRIRKAARAAGLEGDFSGHSPRIGMARDLAASGASTTALMLAFRAHACPLCPRRTRRQRPRRALLRRRVGTESSGVSTLRFRSRRRVAVRTRNRSRVLAPTGDPPVGYAQHDPAGGRVTQRRG